VRYDWPERTRVIIGRLNADDLVALSTDGDPLGAAITVAATDDGINRATLG
jgi:acetyl-CoA C-acetyltransferase